MNKTWLTLFLLLQGVFLSVPASGQISVNGNVSLKSTGKPLSGAHVTISGLKSGAVTDGSGNFMLTVPEKGRYTLKATYVGCTNLVRPLEIDTVPVPFLRLVMEDFSVLMNEITIVGGKDDSRHLLSEPLRMSRISTEMIRTQPGQQITSVLDNISGVNLNSTTGIYGSSQVVSMRGMSGNDQGRTLILLDGVPLNKSDGGSVNWNRINRDNIGEILLIKGPGPAEYGSSAMGGVISMTSLRPVKKISGTLNASYGTFNTFKADYSIGGLLRTGARSGSLYYNLNGFYTRSDGYNPEIPEYLEPGDTFLVNTYVREAQLAGSLAYRFRNGQEIEAGAEIYNDKRGRGVEIYENGGAYDQHQNYMVRLRYQGNWKKLEWRISGFYNQEGFRRMNEFMSDGSYNLYLVKSKRIDMGATGALAIRAGKHQQIRTGLDFKRGSVYGQDIYYTSTDLVTNAGEMELYALYLQDEVTLANGRLKMNAGLRLNGAVFHDGLFTIEYPSYSIEYLSDFQDTMIPTHTWMALDPKLSVQYLFNPDSRIYVSFGKGFRAPNLDDLCRTGKRSEGLRIANPGLGPENLYNIEAGGDVKLFKKLQLSVSAYYSTGLDFIYSVATGDSVNMCYKMAPITQKQNISEVRLYGGEADAEWAILKNMKFSVGYTLSLSRITGYESFPGDTTGNLTGKSLVDVPVHKIVAGYSWTNQIVSFNLNYKYVSSRWINDQNSVDLLIGSAKFPAFHLFGFRAWHVFFKKLTVALDVDNLFDVRYIDNRYLRSPGRVITGELTFNF